MISKTIQYKAKVEKNRLFCQLNQSMSELFFSLMDVCNTLRSLPHPLYQLFAIVKAIVEFYYLVGIIIGEIVVAVIHEAEEKF